MRKRRVPKRIGTETPEERAARRKRLSESLISTLNKNVLRDHPEKSTSSEEINKNGEKNDKRPSE
jgi:hypothetical protein